MSKFNESLQKSFPPQFPQPPPKVDKTFVMHMGTRGTTYTWALNSTRPFPIESSPAAQPTLYSRPQHNNNDSLIMMTNNNTWVDLIFITPELFRPPHTIHKHSNKAFVLGYGEGVFNWTTVEQAAAAIPQSFNFVTPPYRDSFVVPAAGRAPTWMAVRYHVVNPGAFLLHCHLQNHLSGGMSMTILDGVDEWPEVPAYCMN
jgi:FtsP/CotA-like multicopper oxidase with cupredoxin domain